MLTTDLVYQGKTYRSDEWGTITECADTLKTSRQWVHFCIQQGRVDAEKVEIPQVRFSGGTWLVRKPFRIRPKTK